jgi:uncharacterized protein
LVRVVIDTNVLVSSLIGHGKPRRLVSRLLRDHSVVTSYELLAELGDVLPRTKFGLKSEQISRFVSTYATSSEIVILKRRFDVLKEDPDDNAVLDAAVNGKADFVVSGDKHLLELKQFRGVRIVTVDHALNALYSIGVRRRRGRHTN